MKDMSNQTIQIRKRSKYKHVHYDKNKSNLNGNYYHAS